MQKDVVHMKVQVLVLLDKYSIPQSLQVIFHLYF